MLQKSTRVDYFISGTKKNFNFIQNAFIQTSIFYHFEPKYYMHIKSYMSKYIINRVLTQLSLDIINQQHLIGYYLHKMISVKTCWKTHNGEFSASIKVFKI